RLEARCSFEQTDMPFLYQIACWKPEMAKLSRHGNNQAHMRRRDLMHRVLVPIAPAQGKLMFLLTLQIRGLHGLAYHIAACRIVHLALHSSRQDRQILPQVSWRLASRVSD